MEVRTNALDRMGVSFSYDLDVSNRLFFAFRIRCAASRDNHAESDIFQVWIELHAHLEDINEVIVTTDNSDFYVAFRDDFLDIVAMNLSVISFPRAYPDK